MKIPEVGREFEATCVGGYLTRFSRKSGEMFQALLKRLPPGAELEAPDAIPYYELCEDGLYRETYVFNAPDDVDVVVCERLKDILTEAEEMEDIEQDLGRAGYSNLQEIRDFVDKIERYITYKTPAKVPDGNVTVYCAEGHTIWGGPAPDGHAGALERCANRDCPTCPEPDEREDRLVRDRLVIPK